MAPELSLTIARHFVPIDSDRLSPLQARILRDPAPVRVFSAPTGAGKSYALIRAAKAGARVLFVVPTRRLAQNLATEATRDLPSPALGVPSPVALWSSDETARRRELDPEYRASQDRVRQVRRYEEAQFIVATPESMATMLLRAPGGGHGSDPFGLSDLMRWFGHIVFDEFHSIDARGFGLCAVVACACAARRTDTRATFLSATPIDLVPVLAALGVGANDMAVGTETVLDDPRPGEGSPATELRALHGDVRVEFVRQPDLAALLWEQRNAIRACFDHDRQLVVILDSLEELHVQKERLAAVFDRLGVPATRRLAINSIDDSAHKVALGRLFVTDRAAEPTDFPVLLATSSVEMGVTFKAGMIVMDPGHDALSFVQRMGRVARGDESGCVVVRLDPARLARSPWLRLMLEDLRAAPDLPRLSVSRFLDIVLTAARSRFDPKADLRSDDVPHTFRSMPQRAVWAACLFWHAMERGQPRHVRGQREVLRSLMPSKVAVIAAKLKVLEGGEADDRAGFGRRWAHAFLEQAAVLRDFAPTVAVVEPDGTVLPTVPLRLIESRPTLAASPLIADNKGGWSLHLDRPLDAALHEEARMYREARRAVLLPNGQTRSVPARETADATVREMQKLAESPGITAREEAQLAAAIALVRLSGLVPGEADAASLSSNGTAVL